MGPLSASPLTEATLPTLNVTEKVSPRQRPRFQISPFQIFFLVGSLVLPGEHKMNSVWKDFGNKRFLLLRSKSIGEHRFNVKCDVHFFTVVT